MSHSPNKETNFSCKDFHRTLKYHCYFMKASLVLLPAKAQMGLATKADFTANKLTFILHVRLSSTLLDNNLFSIISFTYYTYFKLIYFNAYQILLLLPYFKQLMKNFTSQHEQVWRSLHNRLNWSQSAITDWVFLKSHLMPIFPLYTNCSIYLKYKSIDWFLYDGKISLEWVQSRGKPALKQR